MNDVYGGFVNSRCCGTIFVTSNMNGFELSCRYEITRRMKLDETKLDEITRRGEGRGEFEKNSKTYACRVFEKHIQLRYA